MRPMYAVSEILQARLSFWHLRRIVDILFSDIRSEHIGHICIKSVCRIWNHSKLQSPEAY